MNEPFNPADLQGNIVRGYRMALVRYFLLEVADRSAAQNWLMAAVSPDDDSAPTIATEESWDTKPATLFNIGLTFEGLKALGVPRSSLDVFPTEFKLGMHERAIKLGDVGRSAPENWAAPFDQPSRIHMIGALYADTEDDLDLVQKKIDAFGNGKAFNILGKRDGRCFEGDKADDVHFGYRDNISQPRFIGVHDPDQYPDPQPLVPLGSVLLGFPTVYEGVSWTVPQPEVLGYMGSFNAFRVMEQDVEGFEAYLDEAATRLIETKDDEKLLPKGAEKKWKGRFTRHQAMREIIAAKMCGRWRNGVPMQLSPETPHPDEEVETNNFDFDDRPLCPYGSHIRRCNPRGGAIVQRVANHTRRLVRRGMPYGPPYDRDNPDGEERGLLGNFLCANLGAQFEAVMCDWLNLGLQDPQITGHNDPILGVNEHDQSCFEIPLMSGESIRLESLPSFTFTRGGAYTFRPSIPAIRYIASL